MKKVKINGETLKNMFMFGVHNLSKHKEELDALNIFPVPDGDTGTNMSLTAQAAVKELIKLDSACECEQVAAAVASGSLRGARGNSGVILSQLFRGLSKGMKNKNEITTADFANALNISQKTAYKAVMKPKEGTVLTVARVTAERALEISEKTDDFNIFFKELIEASNAVLSKTMDMLPALKAAQVVDSGGKGLVYIYEGMYEGIFTKAPEITEKTEQKETAPFAVSRTEAAHIEFGYCTEFFIEAKGVTDWQMKDLTQILMTIGDSVVAVNDEEIVKIHVHTNNPGTVLEHALKIGPLSSIKIENMRIQHTSVIEAQNKNLGENKNGYTFALQSVNKVDKTNKDIGIIAVSSGEGMSSIFCDLGCDKVITGGQTMNPSADDILKAVQEIGKQAFIILPNNKNIILAAKQAAEIIASEYKRPAVVIDTKSIPEGICAMVAMVHGKDLEETARLMSMGADSVKTGLVTEAVRDTEIDGLIIKEGDFLGIIGDRIEVIAETSFFAAKQVIDILMDESEIISIYYGEGGNEDAARELLAYVDENGIECELQYGGQPVYSYIISAE